MNLRKTSFAFAALACAAAAATLSTGCGSGGGGASAAPGATGATLTKIEFGRLVDIYAYRRADVTKGNGDRRDTLNRVPHLVARDVVVRADIETEPLFDVNGGVREDANYRFMPFDISVGHSELLILWDDRIPGERDRFESAMKAATTGLSEMPAAFRNQDTVTRPIPVIPRNAALKLCFDTVLGVDTAFFESNPNAVQVLEFVDRPSNRTLFRTIRTRLMADPASNCVIVDTSLLGGEAKGGQTSAGLPPSPDNVRANIRIALPTSGVVSKLIKFAEDKNAELNGVDFKGDNATIRDFRSGNPADGKLGALTDVEPPMIVTNAGMGIIDVDFQNRVVTLNKRFADLSLRGRIPFVDGAIDEVSGLPGGPGLVPTISPLRSGDILLQELKSPHTGETVVIRAEILENLNIVSRVKDGKLQGIGQAPGGGDNGKNPIARVRVSTLTTTDSQGNPISFQSSTLPLGFDASVKVHYYENVPFDINFGTASVSDSDRRAEFLVIDPEPPVLDANRQPVPPGMLVDPMASISLRFSEPMDLLSVDNTVNYFLTNQTVTEANVAQMVTEPKPIALAIVASQLLDQNGDGTLLRLSPPLGHFHKDGQEEDYWFHMMLDDGRITDLSANPVDVFDRTRSPSANWSVRYVLDKDKDKNHVGYRIFRFEALDEDGSSPGSFDCDGQVQALDGKVFGLPTTRFSGVADRQILATVTRGDRGECSLPGSGSNPPTFAPGAPGVMYQCPSHVAVQIAPPQSFTPPTGPQIGGGVKEPHQPRGSKLQMTYREDDFGLSYTNRSHFLLDIEQMHWSPFNDNPVRFDIFDRYTLRMAHAEYRPDVSYVVAGTPPACLMETFALRGGLRDTFAQNILDGSKLEDIVKDARYEINPNNTFKASTDSTFIPYPKFQKSYVWRDVRLVSWDMAADQAIGLGGAHNADAPQNIRETTASVSSPWIPNKPPANIAALHQTGDYVRDFGDFLGYRNEDHNPIALPLLMDFSIHPDDATNGFANGSNLFHIALIGPCWPSVIPPHGFYNVAFNWGYHRAHITGGRDPITGKDILINPEVQVRSGPSYIKDLFLGDPTQGLFQTVLNGRDDHVHWAQADFVRRVSELTFGFWDTLQPNRHDFNNSQRPLPTTWPGKALPNGIPDLMAVTPSPLGIEDFVSIMDPPLNRQPAGTQVTIEFRGADTFDNSNKIFDIGADAGLSHSNIVQQRGNLLNPGYAEEAYRYAMENKFGAAYFGIALPNPGPRVKATGFTPYVTEDRLDSIRSNASGLLPRFMNFRFIMENNLNANPPLQPFLRSYQVAYRVSEGKK